MDRRNVRMPKFALIDTIEVAPGRTEEFVPLLMAHRARCLQDEPGTLQFEVLLPRQDTTKVMLYEVYRDEAAFDTHWDGPSLARLREEATGMMAKVSGTRCMLLE
jgi:quinol monooxygenase YgiN